MRWDIVAVIFWFSYSKSLHAASYIPQVRENLEDDAVFSNEENVIDEQSLEAIYEEQQLDKAMNLLAKLLILPWPKDISPLVYSEDISLTAEENDLLPEKSMGDYDGYSSLPLKRSRYYRKYPWKRQNSKYDPANRFICNPSKEEVYRLLVALHEARQGNRERNVDFCNRKRPAYSVYTNIRFIGK